MMTMRKVEKTGLAGFTAIEIAMVATVIAILALIILPLFRKRTEEARLTAARDDLLSIAKAQILANADTGKYFRLQDLDNPMNYSDPPQDINTEVPIAVWNRELTAGERSALEPRWQAPYYSVQNYITYEALLQLEAAQPRFLRSTTADEGPILDFPLGSAWEGEPVEDATETKIPVDPWGNPYLFFGPGKRIPDDPEESYYYTSVVFSLGPNGLPGDGISIDPDDPENYQRDAKYPATQKPVLGSDDDLMLEF